MVKPMDLKNTIKNDNGNLDLSVLAELIPFLEEEDVEMMANRGESARDIGKLLGLAPFLSKKTLGNLALLYKGNWGNSLAGIVQRKLNS